MMKIMKIEQTSDTHKVRNVEISLRESYYRFEAAITLEDYYYGTEDEDDISFSVLIKEKNIKPSRVGGIVDAIDGDDIKEKYPELLDRFLQFKKEAIKILETEYNHYE